ncbi:MAG TPA: malto-oligosyltrehalose synthase [Acidimicrobiales bacterium]|nr:malto-oligosyltrehalose synthase [Acidimicrobiales bacterium]
MNLGSTYRLQLNGLGFGRARELVPYLAALGVQTLYVSPVLAAAPGSSHGYDVVDPTRIDPALGGADGLAGLLEELDAHGMRLLVDVVPNHMATVAANRWWWDVLRRGRRSRYAGTFDIDWGAHGGRVLLPVLGRPLAEVLGAGELSMVDHDGEPALAYFDQRFPVDPATLADVPDVDAGDLDMAALLDRQHYRLAYWRLAGAEGNYRRFFDVDGLVGIRLEDPAVYRATHRLVLELAADRRVAGLRVDHVDGLADPAAYLHRLRADLDAGRTGSADRAERTGRADRAERTGRPALVIEKIVARDEPLPAAWPVDGMTGYELADLAGGLLVDPAGAEALAAGPPFDQREAVAKAEVLDRLFGGQLDRLVALAADALAPGTDVATGQLRRALAGLTVALPGYRTYLDGEPPSAADRRRLARAVATATEGLDADGRRALVLVHQGLLSAVPGSGWLPVARRWQQLTGAVAAKGVEDTATYRYDGLLVGAEVGGDPGRPAVTPAAFHEAMAERARRHPGSLNATSTHDSKRSEDVRARLAVLSEMPDRWAAQVDRWARRHRTWAAGHGTGPSDHDRRLVYQSIVGTWPIDGPTDGDYRRRVADYVGKAAREAKQATSWLDPDERYERALAAFVGHLLGSARGGDRRFVTEVDRLTAAIGPAAATNSLGLVVLRSTLPGVPDTYQGTELWDFSLVDPDNRRPVDFDRRRRLLAELDQGRSAADLSAGWGDGAVKLSVTGRLLRLRRDRPALFDRSAYLPLRLRGPASEHAVAFARRHRRQWSVTVVPRLAFGLAGPGRFPLGALWGETSVVLDRSAPTEWVEVLTGAPVGSRRGSLRLADVLRLLPVAVLVPAG